MRRSTAPGAARPWTPRSWERPGPDGPEPGRATVPDPHRWPRGAHYACPVPSAESAPLVDLGRRAKAAGRVLAGSSSAVRDNSLCISADLIETRSDRILAANAEDVARATDAGADTTSLDRLRLDAGRVAGMATGLRDVARLPNPVGEVVEGWVRPNGLRVERVRVPLGVIGIIYENRPNVTSDAAGLCVKSVNAAFLRGSSAAIMSNVAVAGILRYGVAKEGLPPDSVVLVEDTSRESATAFMRLRGLIDCLIPRGGQSLIQAVLENATVPY